MTTATRGTKGKLEEFKRLAAQCVEIVRTKDTGTLEYDHFLNADGTECFVHERYRDSAAGLEHMINIGPMMEPAGGDLHDHRRDLWKPEPRTA